MNTAVIIIDGYGSLLWIEYEYAPRRQQTANYPLKYNHLLGHLDIMKAALHPPKNSKKPTIWVPVFAFICSSLGIPSLTSVINLFDIMLKTLIAACWQRDDITRTIKVVLLFFLPNTPSQYGTELFSFFCTYDFKAIRMFSLSSSLWYILSINIMAFSSLSLLKLNMIESSFMKSKKVNSI